jgi:hypothetical protein
MDIKGRGISKIASKVTSCLTDFEGDRGGRRNGNSTRLVDHCINMIFSGQACLISDHYKRGTDMEMNVILFNKVLSRLKFEHKHLAYSNLLCVDRASNVIYIFESEEVAKKANRKLAKDIDSVSGDNNSN